MKLYGGTAHLVAAGLNFELSHEPEESLGHLLHLLQHEDRFRHNSACSGPAHQVPKLWFRSSRWLPCEGTGPFHPAATDQQVWDTYSSLRQLFVGAERLAARQQIYKFRPQPMGKKKIFLHFYLASFTKERASVGPYSLVIYAVVLSCPSPIICETSVWLQMNLEECCGLQAITLPKPLWE